MDFGSFVGTFKYSLTHMYFKQKIYVYITNIIYLLFTCFDLCRLLSISRKRFKQSFVPPSFYFSNFRVRGYMAESVDPAPLSPVVGPSDEECDSDLDLDATLADGAKRVGPKKGKVAALDDPIHLRAVLGKRCSCKKRDCFGQFSGTKAFAEFQQYRADFKSLHKLDQDRVDTCHKSKGGGNSIAPRAIGC